MLACRTVLGWFWFGVLLCVGFRLVFFANVRLWDRCGVVFCSFLACFGGSSGRWVVVRGHPLLIEKVAQGVVTSSRFTKIFFVNND